MAATVAISLVRSAEEMDLATTNLENAMLSVDYDDDANEAGGCV